MNAFLIKAKIWVRRFQSKYHCITNGLMITRFNAINHIISSVLSFGFSLVFLWNLWTIILNCVTIYHYYGQCLLNLFKVGGCIPKVSFFGYCKRLNVAPQILRRPHWWYLLCFTSCWTFYFHIIKRKTMSFTCDLGSRSRRHTHKTPTHKQKASYSTVYLARKPRVTRAIIKHNKTNGVATRSHEKSWHCHVI